MLNLQKYPKLCFVVVTLICIASIVISPVHVFYIAFKRVGMFGGELLHWAKQTRRDTWYEILMVAVFGIPLGIISQFGYIFVDFADEIIELITVCSKQIQVTYKKAFKAV